jgi:hypothetical protein
MKSWATLIAATHRLWASSESSVGTALAAEATGAEAAGAGRWTVPRLAWSDEGLVEARTLAFLAAVLMIIDGSGVDEQGPGVGISPPLEAWGESGEYGASRWTVARVEAAT